MRDDLPTLAPPWALPLALRFVGGMLFTSVDAALEAGRRWKCEAGGECEDVKG